MECWESVQSLLTETKFGVWVQLSQQLASTMSSICHSCYNLVGLQGGGQRQDERSVIHFGLHMIKTRLEAAYTATRLFCSGSAEYNVWDLNLRNQHKGGKQGQVQGSNLQIDANNLIKIISLDLHRRIGILLEFLVSFSLDRGFGKPPSLQL